MRVDEMNPAQKARYDEWRARTQETRRHLQYIVDNALIDDGEHDFSEQERAQRLYRIEAIGTDRPKWHELTKQERHKYIRTHRPPTLIERIRHRFTRQTAPQR